MKTLAAVGAAAAVVATVVAATAGGAPQGRTIKLIELPGGSFSVVDNPPRTTRTTQGEPRVFSGGDIVSFSLPVAVVTGGTGAYAGARGTLRSVMGKNNGTVDTIRLLR